MNRISNRGGWDLDPLSEKPDVLGGSTPGRARWLSFSLRSLWGAFFAGILSLGAGAQTESEEDLEDLRGALEDLREEYEADTEDLQEQIDILQEQVDGAGGAQGSGWDNFAQSLSAYNPGLTVFGNFIGRLDDKEVLNDEGDRVDDRFLFRETELDFRASVDPWADGVLIVAIESEAPGEFETVVEEAYITLKKLPFLNTAPLGLKVKAGRFRTSFGRFNRLHTHDLPQTTRPPSLQNFLGEEGHVSEGLSGDFFVPTPGENNTLQATVQVVNGGDIPVAEDNGSEDLALVGRLSWFFDFTETHSVEVGGSVYEGKFDENGSLDTHLYGIDATYQWRSLRRGGFDSFLLGGELYKAKIDQDGGGNGRPFGGFVWSQVQLGLNTFLGARYDFTENVADEDMESQNAAIYVSYYTTEFLRFRIGYERNKSDFRELDDLDSLFLEINFVFGSHPAEPYWVTR